ncbi:MAG: hypothetical protein EAZ55_04960 [Cytophagales bacterium]|nr:MAG: hypothetical protein EAZ55_04960 [Cytophagales bacterium]
MRKNKKTRAPLQLLVFCLFLFLSPFSLYAQESDVDENALYEAVKLSLLCRTAQFAANEENDKTLNTEIDCQSLATLESSLKGKSERAMQIVRAFKDKRYNSYGKGKLNQRLSKLNSDLVNELKKMKKNEPVWQEGVKVLEIELNTLKDKEIERLKKSANNAIEETTIGETNDKEDASGQNNNNATTEQTDDTKTNKSGYTMIIYFILLILLVGIVFVAYQNQQLRKQLAAFEEDVQQKYNRLDNRIDQYTPIKEHKALILRLNYMNDQVNALMQEIIQLQQKNTPRISPEELFAKRTEHLESYTFNPSVQVMYARLHEGIFYQNDFKKEPNKEFFYKIEIDLEDPNYALFKVVDRNEYHALALDNEDIMLKAACDYAFKLDNAYRIITLEAGLLEKKQNEWIIVKKAKITFE